jgi:hypothetical protein
LKKLTFHISRATTAIVLVGGALINIADLDRLAVTGFIFLLGLPIGLFIFGLNFSIFIWTAMVLGVMFMMNLHNAWEVAASLMAGGLDYQMANQAASAINCVVPSREDVFNLQEKIDNINLKYQQLGKDSMYSGRILGEVVVSNILLPVLR